MTRLLSERPRRAVLECGSDELIESVARLLEAGFRLALVGARHDEAVIEIVYLFVDGRPTNESNCGVARCAPAANSSIAHLNYSASRFEREMYDLFGVQPIGHPASPDSSLHQALARRHGSMARLTTLTPREAFA